MSTRLVDPSIYVLKKRIVYARVYVCVTNYRIICSNAAALNKHYLMDYEYAFPMRTRKENQNVNKPYDNYVSVDENEKCNETASSISSVR